MSNRLQLIIRLLCVAAFLWVAPNGVRAEADVWNGAEKTQPSGWSVGNTTLTISTAAELAWVAETVNNGTVTGNSGETGFEGCKITLGTDIDLNNHNWTPIGKWNDASPKYFKGSFDGGQSIIKNLVVEYNQVNPLYAGLFGLVGNESGQTQTFGQIALFVGEKGINGFRYAGGIVACINSTKNCTVNISKCYVEGSRITAYEPAESTGTPAGASVGSILGYGCNNKNCRISISESFTNIELLSAQTECNDNNISVGGIVGEINDTGSIEANLSFCHRLTTIQSLENTTPHVGGIVGSANPNQSSLSNNATSSITIKTIEKLYNNTKNINIPDYKANDIDGQMMTTEILDNYFENIIDKDAWYIDKTNIPVFKRGGNHYPTPPLSDFLLDETGATPTKISSEDDFLWLATAIAEQSITYANKHYQLTNDITLTSQLKPIGDETFPFTGTFDGNHKCIDNLSFTTDATQYIGLFGCTNGATIKNLGVKVADAGIQIQANGETYLGAIVGKSSSLGKISDCFVIGGTISLTDGTTRSSSNPFYIGAIAGITSGTISNCYSTNDISVNNTANVYCGGIVGLVNASNVSNCYSTGKITAKSSTKSLSGGIAGDAENSATFNQCIALNLSGIEAGGARICGTTNTLTYANCYASPVTKVGDAIINDGATNNKNGLNLKLASLTANAGGCFNSWNTGNWEFGDGTYLPQLKGFRDQPELNCFDYLIRHKVTVNQPAEGGTLAVTYHTNKPLQTGDNNMPEDLELTITTTPTDASYKLKNITADGQTLNSSGSTITVTKDCEITAAFDKYYEITLTQPAEGGALKVTYGSGQTFANGTNSILKGTTLTITATPTDASYQLKNITVGDQILSNSSSTITATKDCEITATFEKCYEVTLTQPAEGGSLKVTTGSGQTLTDGTNSIAENTVLTITATPADASYKMKSIIVNSISHTTNPYQHSISEDTQITAVFEKSQTPNPDPTPSPDPTPTVYYTVTLPAVEGAVTDPEAGEYDVESWSNFHFYLTLDKAYDKSLPIVTTDRGETITPRSSDNAYIIKQVRSDVQIRIDGIVKNPDPVANEKIEANHPKVWKTGNELHIQAVSDEPGYIYTADGKLQTVCHLIAGEVETVRLPDGIYFVRIGKERFKIVL
ncbi:MAG: InlB B-repeat-containing protein [Parabacteroides gordonii]|uniref:InlB B-repeat-containing protein n=1 Tax=Parabacteroides gordonii TaxID=574930 RepID=UPI003A854E44